MRKAYGWQIKTQISFLSITLVFKSNNAFQENREILVSEKFSVFLWQQLVLVIRIWRSRSKTTVNKNAQAQTFVEYTNIGRHLPSTRSPR